MLATVCTSCRWQIAKQFMTFTNITEVWLVGGNKNFVLEITLLVKLEANMCANYRGLSGSECIFHHPSH